MLKYYKKKVSVFLDPFASCSDPIEIDYSEALSILYTTFDKTDMSRDLLSIPNRIKCKEYELIVVDTVDRCFETVVRPGLWNLTPPGRYYDEKGKCVTIRRFDGYRY